MPNLLAYAIIATGLVLSIRCADAEAIGSAQAQRDFGTNALQLKRCGNACLKPSNWTDDTRLVVVTLDGSNLQLPPNVPVVEYAALVPAAEQRLLRPGSPARAGQPRCACDKAAVWPYTYNPWGGFGTITLKFLIDHYDRLPQHILFAHRMQKSWHDVLSVSQLLAKHSDEMAKGAGGLFVSPNKVACHDFAKYCNGTSLQSARFWSVYDAIVPKSLHGFKPREEQDTCLALSFRGKPCCGEYLVSRDVARRRTKAEYQALYDAGAEYITAGAEAATTDLTHPKTFRSGHDAATRGFAPSYKNHVLKQPFRVSSVLEEANDRRATLARQRVARGRRGTDIKFARYLLDYMWALLFTEDPAKTAEAGASELPKDLSLCTGYGDSRLRRGFGLFGRAYHKFDEHNSSSIAHEVSEEKPVSAVLGVRTGDAETDHEAE